MSNLQHPRPATAAASVAKQRPLALARLSGNEAQALNQIAQRGRNASIEFAGQAWQFAMEPLLSGTPLPSAVPGDFLVQALWAGALIDLQLPAHAGLLLTAIRFPDVDTTALPGPFAAAALDLAFDEALEKLRSLNRGPLQIEQVLMQPARHRNLPHHFALVLERDGQAIHGSLCTNALGLMMLAGGFSTVMPSVNRIEEDSIPILLRAEIGSTGLPIEMARQLEVSDTLLIENCLISQQGEIWLGQDGMGIRAEWQDSKLVVKQPFAPIGTHMPNDKASPPAGDIPLPLDKIPLRLSFDLGERLIPLGELKTLQTGQSLDLGHPLAHAVTIRVNGAVFGSGELIEIDGRLGVTITHLAPTAASKP